MPHRNPPLEDLFFILNFKNCKTIFANHIDILDRNMKRRLRAHRYAKRR